MEVVPFDGVRYIKCSMINRRMLPELDSETIKRIRRYYKKTSNFELPIAVTIQNSQFYVVKNYEQLAAAYNMDVERIPATYTDVNI